MTHATSLLSFAGLGLLACTTVWAEPAKNDPDRKGVRWAGVPIFNYTTDLGLSAGAMAQRFDYGEALPPNTPFDSLWTLEVNHSSRGPRYAVLAYETTHVSGSDWRLSGAFDYALDPYAPYFGIGADTVINSVLSSQDFYVYHFESGTAAFSARHPLRDFEMAFSISGSRESSQASPAAPSLFAGTQPSQDDTLLRLGASLIWERRDSEFIPSRGWYGLVALSTGLHEGGPPWPRLDFDYRRYDSLIDHRSLVLATQFRFTASGDHAPLHDKARLGSLGTLRGLPAGRYLANESASLRAELRSVFIRLRIFDLPLKGGVGLFADAGKAGLTLSELGSSPLRTAWGFSLFGSYFTDDFLGSMDVGFSQGLTAVYLRLGHAF